MNLYDLLDKEDKEVSLTFGKGLSVLLAFEGRNSELTPCTYSDSLKEKPLSRIELSRSVKALRSTTVCGV